MFQVLLFATLLTGGEAGVRRGGEKLPADVLTISAHLVGDVTPGSKAELVVKADVKEGWFPADTRFEPLLQVFAPKQVALDGKVLTDQKDLAANEYLMEPYERLIKDGSETVAFTLRKAPGTDAVEPLRFTVMAYLTSDKDNSWFIRRRFEVPLTSGAVAKEVAPDDSTWGEDEDLLQIGTEIEPFELPRADESLFALDEHLYDKNIIVTTYRAYW